MNKKKIVLPLILTLFCLSLIAQDEYTDFGTNIGVGVSKSIGKRFEIGLEEEFRTKNNVSDIDRFSTGVDASFSILRKYLKVGAGYIFMASWDEVDELFEWRHRYYGQLNGRYDVDRFSFKLRSRYQITYRDESVKRYKWNPRHYWRNRFNVSYKVPKIALTPFISFEVFCQTNHYKGNVIDNLRYETGVEYKFDKRNSLELTLRYDDEINVKEPQNKLSVGLFYTYSF